MSVWRPTYSPTHKTFKTSSVAVLTKYLFSDLWMLDLNGNLTHFVKSHFHERVHEKDFGALFWHCYDFDRDLYLSWNFVLVPFILNIKHNYVITNNQIILSLSNRDWEIRKEPIRNLELQNPTRNSCRSKILLWRPSMFMSSITR